jgi:Flp pilus assembly protein TadG
VDMTNIISERVRLQNGADGAALAAASELRLANANASTVIAVAQEFVQANSQPHERLGFTGSVSNDKTTVSVTVDRALPI